jgi:hypothetical protein
MKLTLRQQITQFGNVLQTQLLPLLEEEVGELTETGHRLIAALEMIPLARFVPSSRGWIGRPSKDRLAIASAFVAKAVYGFTLTRQLLDALRRDAQLRRICGWKSARALPHESTFSRAFAEFARMELGQFVHEALIRETQRERLIGHIARDSTAIEAREHRPAPAAGAKTNKPSKRAKGGAGRRPHKRWKGGQYRRMLDAGTRLHRQREMRLSDMLAELPRECSVGAKTNSQGHPQYWQGYKLHLDVADGQIPISAILTGARVHDSQVAIPLAAMSSQRVTYLYELMDAAYDAQEIHEHVQGMGHVPIIDPKACRKTPSTHIPLGKATRQMSWAQQDRYRERTMVERVYARLKDEFGCRQIRVRGPEKVMAHLMFGVLALTVDQLLKIVR